MQISSRDYLIEVDLTHLLPSVQHDDAKKGAIMYHSIDCPKVSIQKYTQWFCLSSDGDTELLLRILLLGVREVKTLNHLA